MAPSALFYEIFGMAWPCTADAVYLWKPRSLAGNDPLELFDIWKAMTGMQRYLSFGNGRLQEAPMCQLAGVRTLYFGGEFNRWKSPASLLPYFKLPSFNRPTNSREHD